MAEMPDVATLTTISSDWGNDIRDRTTQRYSSVANRTTEHPTPAEGDLSYLTDSNTVWVYDGANWVNGIGDGTVVTAQIVDDAVTTVKILDANVTTAKIADDAVTNAKIAAGAVGLTELANNSVNTNKLQDGIITGAKLTGALMSSLMLTGSAVSEGPDTIGATLVTLSAVNVVLTIPTDWNTWACEAYGQCLVTQSADSTSSPTDRITFQVFIDAVSNEFYSSQVGRQAFGGEFGEANSRLTVPFHGFRTGLTGTGSRTISLARSRNGLDNVYTMSNTVLTARAHRLT